MRLISDDFHYVQESVTIPSHASSCLQRAIIFLLRFQGRMLRVLDPIAESWGLYGRRLGNFLQLQTVMAFNATGCLAYVSGP